MVMTYGLQSLAQTRIDSALTGMLMGATPLYTAVFAALLLRDDARGEPRRAGCCWASPA